MTDFPFATGPLESQWSMRGGQGHPGGTPLEPYYSLRNNYTLLTPTSPIFPTKLRLKKVVVGVSRVYSPASSLLVFPRSPHTDSACHCLFELP